MTLFKKAKISLTVLSKSSKQKQKYIGTDLISKSLQDAAFAFMLIFIFRPFFDFVEWECGRPIVKD